MLRCAAWLINTDVSKERSLYVKVLRGSDIVLFDGILLVVIRYHRRSPLQKGPALLHVP